MTVLIYTVNHKKKWELDQVATLVCLRQWGWSDKAEIILDELTTGQDKKIQL